MNKNLEPLTKLVYIFSVKQLWFEQEENNYYENY